MTRFKKPLIIIASILGGLVLLAIIASLILGPRIKEVVINQINTQLKTPVQVDDINFSLIRKFPYASIDFTGIKIQGVKVKGYKEPLFEAGHVYLMFNLLDVFSDQFQLKKIGIDDASVHLYTDENDQSNYDILKQDSTKSGKFNVALDKVDLSNIDFTFFEKLSGRDYVLSTEKATMAGKFSELIYDMNVNGNFFITRFKIDNLNYIDHKNTTLDFILQVNSEKKLYTVKSAEMQVADLKLAVNGTVSAPKDNVQLNLTIQSADAGLKELLSLIPAVYLEKIKDYQYEGNVYFTMNIKGKSDRKTTPLVKIEFGTQNTSIQPDNSEYKLSKIKFKAAYISKISDNRPYSRIQFSGLNAMLEGQPLTANLLIENFANPAIDLDIKSKINLEVLSRFYMPENVEMINGQVLADAHIKGYAKDKDSWVSDGTLVAENVNFRIKGKNVDFKNFNGKFDIDGSRLTVTDLRGNAAGSDFQGSGTFDNIFGYFLTTDEIISGEARITSRNIDLNELLEDKNKDSGKDTVYRLEISNRIDLDIETNIAYLRFRKFEAWQIKGDLTLRNKTINTNNLSFKAFEGSLQLQGSINTSAKDSVLIACEAKVKTIDITELFTQMENFGQQTLIDKNVKGDLTANIQFASIWSKSLDCNADKIYVKSDLLIENGELLNFTPMLALSKYLKGADLHQIKFSSLKNQIEIKNQTIYIPSMRIQSSAMDLTASGTHTFNNIVDYKLQLLLSELIGRNVKANNSEFGVIEDDGLGRMKMFLTMKGPINNPKFTWDRKGVEEKITNDVKQEKQNLKGLLKKEFGWFKKDSVKPESKPLKIKKEELQLETDD